MYMYNICICIYIHLCNIYVYKYISVRLLAMCRRKQQSAAIARLMSKCVRSGWKW